MIRRIDWLGRAAFGALCIAGLSALALPVLIVVGAAAGIFFAVDGDGTKGLVVWLLSLAAAALAVALFFAIFFTAWPLASDWIMEWPGYAAGFAVAGVGLAFMALLVFATPVPLYAAVIGPLAGTFAVGFGIAGRLAGLGAPAARPRVKAKAFRHR